MVGRTDYIAQEMDSCCFVYAVANYQIWKGEELPDLEQAKHIACCGNGSTINHQEVIDYFGACLQKTHDEAAVFEHGGIININHPVWNGHSFFLYPTVRRDKEIILTAVNSWLGPLVAEGLSNIELLHFISEQFGYFWVGDST
jgi:hypothetical protein